MENRTYAIHIARIERPSFREKLKRIGKSEYELEHKRFEELAKVMGYLALKIKGVEGVRYATWEDRNKYGGVEIILNGNFEFNESVIADAIESIVITNPKYDLVKVNSKKVEGGQA